jgi:hypothetical protein
MDTHPESVIDTALDQASESFGANSFEAALNAAFNGLEAEPAEIKETPKETPAETPAETPESTEEKVAEETQPEADPFDELTEDIEWTPKAANRFKQLKEELKDSRSELDQLRQRTKEQDSKINEMTALVENKDIEELQARVEQYEHAQMFSNLEQSNAYKEAVSKPLQSLMSQTDVIADKYDVDPNMLIDVISLSDSDMQDEKISELLPNASDRDKARIYRIIEEIGPILERRKTLYDNVEAANQEAEMLQETKNKQELVEKARHRESVTKNVMERITEKLPFVKAIEGLDLKAIEAKVAGVDPSVIHPVDFAYNAVSAQLFPKIVREHLALLKEFGSLADKLAEYETAEPTISGGSASKSNKSGGAEGNFIDAINKAMGF